MLASLGLTTLAGSKGDKGDELPRSGPAYLAVYAESSSSSSFTSCSEEEAALYNAWHYFIARR